MSYRKKKAAKVVAWQDLKCRYTQEQVAEQGFVQIINQAMTALQSVNLKDIVELKSCRKPAESVTKVLQALAIMFGHTKQADINNYVNKGWKSDASFLKTLITFDREGLTANQ